LVSAHHEKKRGGQGGQNAKKRDGNEYVHVEDYPVNHMTESSASSKGLLRKWLVLAAALFFAVLTARLGVWQLSRAEQKLALQQAIENQRILPVLSAADLLKEPALWQQTHRRVQIEGQWIPEKTVYLDNRQHHGQPGFWVMTPFRWSADQVVWVQRGWVLRDPVNAGKAPPVSTPAGRVMIAGRVATDVSHMVELKPDPVQTPKEQPRIQANLDRAQMQALVSDKVSGLMVQTDPDSEGLRRDWTVVAVSADKNTAYAFQWFALSGLIIFLYVWFQWIRPFRHARN
jgi:surfeit locus 1 family protein